MSLLRNGAAALLTWTLSAAIGPAFAEIETISVYLHDEVVGKLVAETQGATTDVSFNWQSNGRGPDLHEAIELKNGVPVKWSISGASMMGGGVDEKYEWKDGRAAWSSAADNGEASSANPPVYINNDGSPWRLGVWARALLADADHQMDVLPTGSLRMKKVRDLAITDGPKPVEVTVWRMIGTELFPDYVMLDPGKKLFAYFSIRDIGIREGYEENYETLLALFNALEEERVKEITADVTHKFDKPIRIRNARIFDPVKKALSPLSTVVVMHDRITRVVSAEDDVESDSVDEIVINAEGGTLLPGLYDMHSHAKLDSGLFHIAAGVTSSRDMGNYNDFLLDLYPKTVSGEIASPRLVYAGILEGHSQYALNMGFKPDTQDDAMAAVRWYADRGYQMIKFYSSFNPDWVEPVTEEAHRLGLEVGGHIPAFTDMDAMVAAGYDTVVHMNLVLFNWLLDPHVDDTRTLLRVTGLSRASEVDLNSKAVKKSVRDLARHDVAVDGTNVILERLMLSRAGEVHDDISAYIDHMPVNFQRQKKRTIVTIKSQEQDEAYKKGFETVLGMIKMLHDNGVTLLPGTDDATGFALHRELELYTVAGIEAAEALRLATLGAAEHLGQESNLGSIETGKFADLVLIDGDPTENIAAIKQPRMVMKGGDIFFPSEIYEHIGIKPFAPPPALQTLEGGE